MNERDAAHYRDHGPTALDPMYYHPDDLTLEDIDLEALEPKETPVWISTRSTKPAKGRNYHTDPDCSHFPNSYRTTTLAMVTENGFDECKRCSGEFEANNPSFDHFHALQRAAEEAQAKKERDSAGAAGAGGIGD